MQRSFPRQSFSTIAVAFGQSQLGQVVQHLPRGLPPLHGHSCKPEVQFRRLGRTPGAAELKPANRIDDMWAPFLQPTQTCQQHLENNATQTAPVAWRLTLPQLGQLPSSCMPHAATAPVQLAGGDGGGGGGGGSGRGPRIRVVQELTIGPCGVPRLASTLRSAAGSAALLCGTNGAIVAFA